MFEKFKDKATIHIFKFTWTKQERLSSTVLQCVNYKFESQLLHLDDPLQPPHFNPKIKCQQKNSPRILYLLVQALLRWGLLQSLVLGTGSSVQGRDSLKCLRYVFDWLGPQANLLSDLTGQRDPGWGLCPLSHVYLYFHADPLVVLKTDMRVNVFRCNNTT